MKALVWATIDTLSCLLLVVLAAINPPVTATTSAIETHGRWVVVTSWEASDNDVDTWLQTPDGQKVWWRNTRTSSAHLEQDDLGYASDTRDDNIERVVLRSVQPGESIVNLHCYACYDTPISVTVELWRLQDVDKRVYRVQVVLRQNGQEETALRFRLDQSGSLRDINRLPAQIVLR